MAAVNKYVKAPITNNLQLYTDDELRKLEKVISAQAALIDYFLEESELATETGLWTPVIVGNTTAGVGTYSVQFGHYFKRDRLVIVRFRVTTTAHTGTGRISINNLPFAVDNPNAQALFSTNVWSSLQTVEVALAYAPNKLDMYGPNPSGAMAIVNAMDFAGSLVYIAAA